MAKTFNLPKGLDPRAEAYMKRVIKYLTKNNQIDDVDDAALTMLSINYSMFMKASDDVLENGLTAKGSRGNDIPNPSIKIANDCQVQAVKIMEKFGLTAKDRKKLMVDDDVDDDSPLMQFMKEGKETR